MTDALRVVGDNLMGLTTPDQSDTGGFIPRCLDTGCKWRKPPAETFREAMTEGREHSRAAGHTVKVEK